ncbi:MAG: membrane dipeptidase [Anaerolineae bacterium]|nr:membrane dipeptidase [Anaerolineae bacterium]
MTVTNTKPLVIDAHQDIAWNMIAFERDYTRSFAETREIEKNSQVPQWNGDTLIGWDAYQEGRVAVVFSTLFSCPLRYKEGLWDIVCYGDNEQAHQQYRRQLELYQRLAGDKPDHFRLLFSKDDLKDHLSKWGQAGPGEQQPVGLVILMEGADGVRAPQEAAQWWEWGVRILGPAWAGTRYCGGTKEPGPLTKDGFALLDVMADTGMILDISHMDEPAVLQTLDYYPGRIIATHANPQALLKGKDSNRFLSDRVIQGLVEREAVIGVVPYNSFLNPEWVKGAGREMASLDNVVAHIDHICQIAGSAKYTGIGTDADGGFGLQSVPVGYDSIADLQKLGSLLIEKGYSEEDMASILGGNWAQVLEEALPE